jgi:hypothetical protein
MWKWDIRRRHWSSSEQLGERETVFPGVSAQGGALNFPELSSCRIFRVEPLKREKHRITVGDYLNAVMISAQSGVEGLGSGIAEWLTAWPVEAPYEVIIRDLLCLWGFVVLEDVDI